MKCIISPVARGLPRGRFPWQAQYKMNLHMFDHILKIFSKPRKVRFVKLSSFLDLVNVCVLRCSGCGAVLISVS